eukprot:5712496-Alexandrium_andersonii.AAC.1
MLIAPPRVGSAGGASGVTGEALERPDSSGAPGGTPSDGERRAVQRKGAVMRGFAWQGAG